jgi:hypothetical protein
MKKRKITKVSGNERLVSFVRSFLSVAARDHIRNCIEEERKKYKNMKLQKKNFFSFRFEKKLLLMYMEQKYKK